MSAVETTQQALAARAGKIFMPNFGVRDMAVVRARGSRCWDADGREFLDFLGGIAVAAIGHNHPDVVDAIKKQAEAMIHCSNFFLIESQIELAELLVENTGMERVFFCNSGTEATEAAIKLARLWSHGQGGPPRRKVMIFENCFHGRTYGSMSATWAAKVREGFDPLVPGFGFAKLNDLESVDSLWDDDVCAVMVESVQGEGGIHPCTEGFLQGLRQRCTERNALLICDEIQCGMSRTGKPMAYQWAGIEPDVVPLAKALGGGLPLGALCARGEAAEVLQPGTHGSTFGGNPVACAAGVAVCRHVFEPDFLKGVGERACRLWGVLDRMRGEFPDLIAEVRGKGLMVAIVLKVPGMDLVKIARDKGLLINCTAGSVVRFLPALNVEDSEIEECEGIFRESLARFAESR